ncbi:MAG TPA: imidazolonepropionase [Thermoflexia bacterium]|nr:imidazolonepropionase [Thermoflexia bacterium]
MKADLLIHSAAQLCVVPPHDGGPQRGPRLGDLGIIEDGAVACADSRIVAVGPTERVRADWWAPTEIDASGKVVCPGFVDPHTHVVWAGSRAEKFAERIREGDHRGTEAADEVRAIVRATRAAPLAQLVAETRSRLDRMLAHGTTTVEVKTGYGLSSVHELRLLEAIAILEVTHPLTLVPTFLGAYVVPDEFLEDPNGYTDQVIDMLPLVACPGDFREGPCLTRTLKVPFCDVLCDEGGFTAEQARRILERARELGMDLKVHADQFRAWGGAALAVEMEAASADHLTCTPPEEIERLGSSDTVAVLLPATSFGLGLHRYAPARAILEAGGALALGTNCNATTSWCESMPLVIALACRYLQLTPEQALVAATLNAAYAIGLGGTVGSLQVGWAADILILNVPDVHHLGYRFGTNPVERVIKEGKIVVG